MKFFNGLTKKAADAAAAAQKAAVNASKSAAPVIENVSKKAVDAATAAQKATADAAAAAQKAAVNASKAAAPVIENVSKKAVDIATSVQKEKKIGKFLEFIYNVLDSQLDIILMILPFFPPLAGVAVVIKFLHKHKKKIKFAAEVANELPSTINTVKRHKRTIQVIFIICLVALLLLIIFGGGGLMMKILLCLVSFVILILVTLVMAMMVVLHVWPFK